MKALSIADGGRVEEVAALCRANGLGIELQTFFHPDVIDRDDLVESHRTAVEGLSPRSMHGPFADLCPGSCDSMVRDVARRRFESAYGIAERLEITDIVLHHGYVPHTTAPRDWVPRMKQFWRDFLESKSAAIRFHLENMLDWEPGLLLDVVEAVDRPNVDVNLDVGHVYSESKATAFEWIEALGSRIGYVHLHDNGRDWDEHLALGRGTIPLEETCHALREHAPDAIWALEVCDAEAVRDSLTWLHDHGFLSARPIFAP